MVKPLYSTGSLAFGALAAEPLYLLADTAIVGHLGTAPLAGLGIAGYLTYTRYSGAPIVCATGGCETVQHSRYAVVAGIPVAVMVAPIVPALNESEIPAIVEAARDAGATSAGTVLLRLPTNPTGSARSRRAPPGD